MFFVAILVAVGLWVGYRVVRGKAAPLPALASAGVITFLVHPHPISYEQLTFFIPLLLWIRYQPHLPAVLGLSGWFIWIFLTWIPLWVRAGSDAVNSLPVIPAAIWAFWLMRQQKPSIPPPRISSPEFVD